MEEKQEPTTVKRPSSEQRKLRSRDAARYRRSQETEVFYELAHTLPLPRRVSTHLDKSAIMRASLSFLWLRRVLQSAGENPTEESQEKEEDPMDSFYPQVLSGFIMVITEEGDLIYLTENVSRYIGITQLELLGQSVVDFVHPCDQEHLRDLLAPRPGGNKKQLTEQPSERNFFLRMKSTLTSRGRTVNIKSASWKVLHCTGQMRPFGGHSRSPPAPRVMTLLCEPIPHPSSVEFPLDASTFLTRHSMDLHFTQCEGRVTELVGYKPDDLIGRSAYGFYHTFDSDHVSKSLRTLFSKGQVSTSQYRFLAKSGGFVWAETQATVLYNSKTSQPEAIVCLNFILSAVEQPDIIFSIEQIRHSKTEAHSEELAPEVCETADSCEPEPVDQHLTGSSPTKNTDSNASSAAELFFKLKEKPEELLQLAPEAGEVVPLSDFAELSFFTLPITTPVPNRPQDICTPQLLQLLSPIFSNTLPSSSSPASSLDPLISGDLPQSSCEPDMIDNSRVEKFFAICSVDGQKKEETLKEVDEMDLEMLAPYISMDDDFQLTVLSSLPEEDDKPSSSSSEPSAVVQTVPAGRKRTHDLDEAMLSQLMIQDKRQKRGATLIEEDLLLNHKSLGCLYETDLSNLVLEAGPAVLNILLTDRDPLLGGGQGLCDTAALMKDIFIPHSPDLSPPLSSLT